MARKNDENKAAVRYLASGLGLTDAVNRTMDIATFAAGRSQAIKLLDKWERIEFGYTGVCVCDEDSECVFHHVMANEQKMRARAQEGR